MFLSWVYLLIEKVNYETEIVCMGIKVRYHRPQVTSYITCDIREPRNNHFSIIQLKKTIITYLVVKETVEVGIN